MWKDSSQTHAYTQIDTQEIYQYFLSVGSTYNEMQIKFRRHHILIVASQVAPVVKNLPSNAIDVRDPGLIPGLGRSPGGGHSNPLQFLAWRIPWAEEPGRPQSIGSYRVRQWLSVRAHTHTHTHTTLITYYNEIVSVSVLAEARKQWLQGRPQC